MLNIWQFQEPSYEQLLLVLGLQTSTVLQTGHENRHVTSARLHIEAKAELRWPTFQENLQA